MFPCYLPWSNSSTIPPSTSRLYCAWKGEHLIQYRLREHSDLLLISPHSPSTHTTHTHSLALLSIPVMFSLNKQNPFSFFSTSFKHLLIVQHTKNHSRTSCGQTFVILLASSEDKTEKSWSAEQRSAKPHGHRNGPSHLTCICQTRWRHSILSILSNTHACAHTHTLSSVLSVSIMCRACVEVAGSLSHAEREHARGRHDPWRAHGGQSTRI